MKTLPASQNVESVLGREWRIFKGQLGELVDHAFNWVFSLAARSAQRRGLLLLILFTLIGFLVSLQALPLAVWQEHLQKVFVFIFNPSAAQAFASNPFFDLAGSLMQAFSAPGMLIYLSVAWLPFLIALQLAATYLSDIFELNRAGVARKFILQVALTGSRKQIRISEGQVAEEDHQSATYLIGGPGRVLVDLDSAALFERADGSSRVIGPTVDQPRKLAMLEGFERFRGAIDLRDQYTDSLSVSGRSLDGIAVNARDVRMLFSVWRGDQPAEKLPTLKRPYPFIEEAIYTLIYGRICRVTTGVQGASECPPWTHASNMLIRNRMRDFISQHNLSEFLASIGAPEVKNAKKQETEIVQESMQMTSPDDAPPASPTVAPAPPFHPRREVSNLFSQFADEFTRQSQRRGVELHWIGVGTWETPSQIIPERHLEAWRISRENMLRNSPEALQELRDEATLQETLRLVHDVLSVYRQYKDSQNSQGKAQRQLLLAYRGQLEDAAAKERKKVKDDQDADLLAKLKTAVEHIDRQWAHVINDTSG
jgi:hypothetical protein